MLAFSPTPYSVAQHSSSVQATSATAVTWPASPFTVPTVVRILSTTQASMSIAAAPAPSNTTDLILAPNVPEFVILPAGMKIGVLADTTAGSVCFSPLT